MDEGDIGVEDVQQNAEKRMDGGSGSGERRNTVAEEARVAWHGEEDSVVFEKINEGEIVTKSPMNPNSFNDEYPIMDVTSNGLAHLNPGTNN